MKESECKNAKSILFMLPGAGDAPSGGFKVVYEYANRLASDGFEVHVAYRSVVNFEGCPIKEKLRCIVRHFRLLRKGYSCRSWFPLSTRVKEHLVISLKQFYVPKCDICFATDRGTASYVRDYPVSSERKFYLIQGFENWGVSDDVVYETYHYGLNNIAVSSWLRDKVVSSGNQCILVKNGFDLNYFKLSMPIEKRNRYRISMLYHWSKLKGCRYGIEALQTVKHRYPQLSAVLFGTVPRGDDIPDWIEYHQLPDCEMHNAIYNSSSIYLAPSLQEGWGLTVGEAMICGAAVVCTDALGFREMVCDGDTGLIVPAKDSSALANALIKLIENDDLRIGLAVKGNQHIQQFDWDSSYRKLLKLLH